MSKGATADCAAADRALMTIAVIGATGGVGRHVVRLGLEQGHTVVAFARDPTKIASSENDNNKLRKEKLDLAQRDVGGLSQALGGVDLVLSCLGNRRGEASIVANGTATIMAAMEKAKVSRLAMISSIGVGDSRLQLLRLGFGGWVFAIIFATILKKTKEDLNAAEALAIGAPAGMIYGAAQPHSRPSGVHCVVVRPAGLSDAPGEGKYDVALADGTVGASVSREDVARFMLTLTSEEQYDDGAVSVGGNAPRTGH